MTVLDLILNVACLLLWLNWRSLRFANLPEAAGVSLVGTLQRTGPRTVRSWNSLIALFAILFLRTVLYWQLGPQFRWTPNLELGAVALPFRSDYFDRMVLFSLTNFGVWLLGLYACLLLLSVLNNRLPDTDPLQRMIRLQLGWLERLPIWFRLVLPLGVAAAAWLVLRPLLTGAGLVPVPVSALQVFGQAAVIGMSVSLVWKFLLIALLILHLLNSYLYLGSWSIWSFASTTARPLLRPFRPLPLRIGRVDLAPFLAILVIVVVAEGLAYALPELYRRV